jgi:hypothetical protein
MHIFVKQNSLIGIHSLSGQVNDRDDIVGCDFL